MKGESALCLYAHSRGHTPLICVVQEAAERAWFQMIMCSHDHAHTRLPVTTQITTAGGQGRIFRCEARPCHGQLLTSASSHEKSKQMSTSTRVCLVKITHGLQKAMCGIQYARADSLSIRIVWNISQTVHNLSSCVILHIIPHNSHR